MNYVSLFSGIGGLDLGFDRAGWNCVGQVEIDPYCRKILERHWPLIPKHDDVTTAVDWWNETDRPRVDAVVGGFPCQDVSLAGKRGGLAGARTGLYWAALQFAAHVQAHTLVLENVPGLLSSNGGRDFGVILDSLAQCGFDVEWSIVSACSVGAPHLRRRLFIVADSGSKRRQQESTSSPRHEGENGRRKEEDHITSGDAAPQGRAGWWSTEPSVGLLADGLPSKLVRQRLKGLGNAVVPQVGELVGRRVISSYEPTIRSTETV